MKTKIIFLLAAIMLSCASAFAQSGPIDPAKGDVNEDGVVDVADITAVIEIMKNGGGTVDNRYYFSVGTTVPTASNYTTVNNATTTIPTTQEFTSSARVRHYFLIPNNKTLTVLDKVAQVAVPITENTSASIPNHKVYQTNGAIASGATVIITLDSGEEWKHFYFGTTKPTADNYETLTPQYSSLSDMINATVHVPSGGRVYLLFPYSDSPSMIQLSKMITDSDGNGVGPQSGENNVRFVGPLDNSSIDRHFIWELSVDNETTLTFHEPTYYWYIGKDESLLGKSGLSYDLDLSKLPTVSSINDIYSDSQYVGDIENNIYVVCPTEWVGQFKLTDLAGFEIPQSDKTSQITSEVTGYSILRGNGKIMDSRIKVVRN